MRGLILFISFLILYYSLRSVFRSAVNAYRGERPRERGRAGLKGEDLVQDPECLTYVIRDRAVTRRIGGTLYCFCSEECAASYEKAHRG